MPVKRHSPVTQADMDELASKANDAIPSWARTGNYSFPSSSNLWFTEMNRIRADMFTLWGYNQTGPITQSNYTAFDESIVTRDFPPAFVSQRPKAVSGPWMLKGSSPLTNGANGWQYEDVEYWYPDFGQTQVVGTHAFYDGGVQFGNVLCQNPGDYQVYSPTTKIEFRIGGADTVYYSQQGNITFTVYQSASVVADPVPGVVITTNIPNYQITTSYASYGGGYGVRILDQYLDPDVYYIALTANPGWEFYNNGVAVIGNNGVINTMLARLTSSTAEVVTAVSKLGNATSKKIVATNPSPSNWPFGIFIQYCPARFGGSAPTFRDIMDGLVKVGGSDADTENGSIWFPSSVRWTASPHWSGYFVGKTIPILNDGIRDLDLYLPHTFHQTGLNIMSSLRASSSYTLEDDTSTNIEPSLFYGVAEWPTLHNSQSVSQSLIWSSSFGVGNQINGILISRAPTLNGSGFAVDYSGSAQTIYLAYYSGSTRKELTSYVLPENSSSVCYDAFLPCFSQLPLCIGVNATGSTTGSKPSVECFVSDPVPWIGKQEGVANNPYIPWKSGYYYPVSAFHYNDLMASLSAISASLSEG